ncbi:MAG: branched-chain amino acid ABC transporter permease [Deltaproteobacteria bacterium]|nr:branched-chain amino acid ABC transporter permease [Deltaproteobacteria bacterium]
MDVTFILQLVINGLVVGSIYALVATGFVIIYKSSSVLNLAQGEFLMVGAYICLHMLSKYNIPFWQAILITFCFSAILGILIERLILRPLIGSHLISVIMVTLGLSSILKALVQLAYGTDTIPFPEIFPSAPVQIGPIPVSQGYLYALACVTTLVVFLTLFFKYSKTGLAMRATASSQQVALSMGISVKKMFAISWAIAAMVSAVGGVLLGTIRGGIDMSLSFMGLKVLPVVILGGLDSILGAIVGGIIIGVLENLSGGFVDPLVGGGAKEVAPYVALILILMFKPYGLFGKKKIERV